MIGDSSQWREIERLRLQNRKLKLALIVALVGGTLTWVAGLLSATGPAPPAIKASLVCDRPRV